MPNDAANEKYAAAVNAAKEEFESLLPEYQKMSTRIAHLRQVILGGSGLLGWNVEDEHMWPQGPPLPRILKGRK